MGDVRPELSAALTAFANSVPVVVTRTTGERVSTSAFWLTEQVPTQPFGSDLSKRDPRRILVVPRSAVPTAERGTTIDAAEYEGGQVRRWKYDSTERVEFDAIRMFVTLAAG